MSKKYKILEDFIDTDGELMHKGDTYFWYGGVETPFVMALVEHDYIEEILEKPKTVEDLKDGDEFYYLDNGGSVYRSPCGWSDRWEPQLEQGNVFLGEKEAEKELARRKAKQILLKDTKGFKPDIHNLDVARYYVAYDPTAGGVFATREGFDDVSHEIVFESYEDANESMKNHRQEWLAYLGVEEKNNGK